MASKNERAERLLADMRGAFRELRDVDPVMSFCGFSKAEARKIEALRQRALRLKGDSEAADRCRLVARLTCGSFRAERYRPDPDCPDALPLVDGDEMWRVGNALWGEPVYERKFLRPAKGV